MLRGIEINNLHKMNEPIFLSDKAKNDDDAISALGGDKPACRKRQGFLTKYDEKRTSLIHCNLILL